jgi:ferredoxin-type protein NapH
VSLLRVAARRRDACDDCNDCFAVCPEPQVIRQPLKDGGASPVVLSSQCTNCGRCIDVCSKEVFVFGSRFSKPIADATGAASAAPE